MKTQQITDANGKTTISVDGKEVLSFVEEIRDDGSGVLLRIAGEINNYTALHLIDELDAFRTVGADITLDMSEVSYLNSRIQIELQNLQEQIDRSGKGMLKLIRLSAVARAELERSGAIDYLDVE